MASLLPVVAPDEWCRSIDAWRTDTTADTCQKHVFARIVTSIAKDMGGDRVKRISAEFNKARDDTGVDGPLLWRAIITILDVV